MKGKKPLWVGLLVVCLSTGLTPWQSFAAEQSVKVTLPEFEVKLNGNDVENQYRQYPLLVYKDITYFPMTYYDARLLGLQTNWSPDEGLSIGKDHVASSYMPYKTSSKNAKSFKATIPNLEITINNKTVNNAQEQYPLLSYNDVIYFPLTWRFAHDEFGWQYEWESSKGLSIQSDNAQLISAALPAFAGDNDVALFKDYYYFVETTGTKNEVFRAPVQDTSHKELVYSYELDTSYGLNKNLKFDIRDGELWFSYHSGGAIMGSDEYCKVNSDGKATQEHRGYLDFKNSPTGTLTIRQFVPPGGNNLSWIASGADAASGINVGDPNLIYGWHIGAGYSSDRSTTIIGDNAYVLASTYPVGKENLNRIYRVNLKTNETDKIIDTEVSHFKLVNNKLYYVKDEDQSLYVSNLDGTGEQKLSHNQVGNWYDEIGGEVYYTSTNAVGQIHLYKSGKTQEDKLLLNESIDSVQRMNEQLICKLTPGGDYGVKVLDASGKVQLAIADQVSRVFVNQDQFILVSAEDQSIKLVK